MNQVSSLVKTMKETSSNTQCLFLCLLLLCDTFLSGNQKLFGFFLFQLMEGMQKATVGFSTAIMMMRQDSWLPGWAIGIFSPSIAKTIKEGPVKLSQFMLNRIQEHRETFDPDHPRDIMDQYIKHRSRDKDFSDYRFACTMIVLTFDGIETTSYLVLWSLLLLACDQGQLKYFLCNLV